MFSKLKKINRGLLLLLVLVLCCTFYLLIMDAVDRKARSTISDMSYTFTENMDKAFVASDPNLIYSYDNSQSAYDNQNFASEIVLESIDRSFSDKSSLPKNADISQSLFSNFEFIANMQLQQKTANTSSKSEVVKIKSVSIYKDTGGVTAEVLWEFETTDSDGKVNSYAEWCEESFSFYKEDDKWYFESWMTSRGNSLLAKPMTPYNYSDEY